MSPPLPVGVLASGEGTNLQALLDSVHGREAQIVGVASDKPDARALARAGTAGVPTEVFPLGAYADRPARDVAIADWLAGRGVRLVVLAGYMTLLTPDFLARFPRAVLNVHPTLLPAFPGMRSVQQAVDYGVKVFGVTVHLVDEGVDTGPIVAQEAVPVLPDDDEQSLHERIKTSERSMLVEWVGRLARHGFTVRGRSIELGGRP
jgi:phosphoribosylglycinamide formyltransferase-1